MSRKYLANVHDFRVLSIMGIVAAHSLQIFQPDRNDVMGAIIDSIANQSSIWFFFIAGYMFLYLSDGYTFRDYIAKKIRFILLPYLIISMPALILSTWYVHQDVPAYFYDWPWYQRIAVFLLTGKHLAPLWFVPTISLIYLLSSLLLTLDRARWLYWSLLALIPLSAAMGRDGVQEALALGPFGSPLSKAVYLLPAYVFGMFCCRYRELMGEILARFWVPVAALVCLFLVLTVVTRLEGPPHWIFLWKLTFAPLVMHAFAKASTHVPQPYAEIGDLSFGIFFVHGYLIAAANFLIQQNFSERTFGLSLPLFLGATILVTLASVMILKTGKFVLGRRSRYVFGC